MEIFTAGWIFWVSIIAISIVIQIIYQIIKWKVNSRKKTRQELRFLVGTLYETMDDCRSCFQWVQSLLGEAAEVLHPDVVLEFAQEIERIGKKIAETKPATHEGWVASLPFKDVKAFRESPTPENIGAGYEWLVIRDQIQRVKKMLEENILSARKVYWRLETQRAQLSDVNRRANTMLGQDQMKVWDLALRGQELLVKADAFLQIREHKACELLLEQSKQVLQEAEKIISDHFQQRSELTGELRKLRHAASMPGPVENGACPGIAKKLSFRLLVIWRKKQESLAEHVKMLSDALAAGEHQLAEMIVDEAIALEQELRKIKSIWNSLQKNKVSRPLANLPGFDPKTHREDEWLDTLKAATKIRWNKVDENTILDVISEVSNLASVISEAVLVVLLYGGEEQIDQQKETIVRDAIACLATAKSAEAMIAANKTNVGNKTLVDLLIEAEKQLEAVLDQLDQVIRL